MKMFLNLIVYVFTAR